MRLLFTLLALFTFSNTFCQENNFDTLLKSGKDILKSHDEVHDYALAVENLLKAVALKPNDAEAHYFLGYAYSRMNSFDGRSIPAGNVSLTLQASIEFETVNKLTPKYKGELLLLDPYSKISSEWGTIAMRYWGGGKTDSMKWALAEGKNRGGFSEMNLGCASAMLNHCETNAILLSYGDNPTFPLLYCQMALGIRNDVTVVDLSLLNTIWYPTLLADKKMITFDLPHATLDSIEYIQWTTKKVTIKEFSWSVPPSYAAQYLLRGDRVLLSLLKANSFNRSIYFTPYAPKDVLLGLDDYIQSSMIVQRLNVRQKAVSPGLEQQKKELATLGPILAKANSNSHEELISIDQCRYATIAVMGDLLNHHKKEEAKILYDILNRYVNENTFPIINAGVSSYMKQIGDFF